MSIENGNLPAQPLEFSGFGQCAPEVFMGLTKREHFAAMAMQGLLSAASDKEGTWTHGGWDNVAYEAANIADALLAELEK